MSRDKSKDHHKEIQQLLQDGRDQSKKVKKLLSRAQESLAKRRSCRESSPDIDLEELQGVEQMEQSGRGGRREGAGRKPVLGEPATERLAFRITPLQAKLLAEQREVGESPNQAARRILLEKLAELGHSR